MPSAPGFPRRVLIAPDKFKGTLTSDQAARAIEKGLRRAWPGVETTRFTLTDGGDGFTSFMVRQTGGRLRSARTTDAADRPIRASWGVLGDDRTAVIGLTEASGIAHLPRALLNPEQTSNLGTGRLLKLAQDRGYREILVGLGGSATNEGGISLAAAFGFQFLDATGRALPPTGGSLQKLHHIVRPAQPPSARFVVATDVENPLFGPRGAARQFARQKGADDAMIARLEAGLRRLARIATRDLGVDFSSTPGAGAAGGCGFGLMTFLGAKREDGFGLVRRLTQLDAVIRAHDLVITGEGCFDRTSLLGKAPAQLGALCRKLHRPAWALCGRVDLPRTRSPFVRLEGIVGRDESGPAPGSLSAGQHARRLENLAWRTARSYRHDRA